jgi:hypothetical protein
MPKTPRLLRPGKCRFGQGGCRRCGFRDHRHRQDDAASATAVTGAEPEDPARRLAAQGDPDSPGVFYVTADPWGNNEQNAQIFIHGFNYQQLGYTLRRAAAGHQNYGNYNGLAPQRAVISENAGRAVVSTGAGDLDGFDQQSGWRDRNLHVRSQGQSGLDVAETIGSYGTSRTYARVDEAGPRRKPAPISRVCAPAGPGMGFQWIQAVGSQCQAGP